MTATTTNEEVKIIDVSPELLETWLKDGTAVLVDVREDFEHATERIDDARHHPLSKFDAESLRKEHPNKRVVFHCRSGGRSTDAATRFRNTDEEVFHLAGGINNWKQSGKPTIRSANAPKLDIMRQVQIIAGTLILVGVILALTIHINFVYLSAFVGAGLAFAGLTGWCGMAMLLGKMPWNKVNCTSCTIASKPQNA
jgi:rhodanese-related sulfurtransferase